MSSNRLLTYEQVRAAIGNGRSHLLLGNGFSISCDSRFLYGKLFDFAKTNGLTERVLGVFERLGTNNFEGVMRLLEDADWLARHYGLLQARRNPNQLSRKTAIGQNSIGGRTRQDAPGTYRKSRRRPQDTMCSFS